MVVTHMADTFTRINSTALCAKFTNPSPSGAYPWRSSTPKNDFFLLFTLASAHFSRSDAGATSEICQLQDLHFQSFVTRLARNQVNITTGRFMTETIPS